MSAGKCARCDTTVYPVEGLRCLDKIWHKGCFKCHECNMTLNMKNYKGFEKRPYCNAHCPQAKATTVADTPEIRRLAENTRIQSQAKYHEDFEKSKGKGFTTVLDDPEMRRIKETSKIISNVAYHGELERKKQMEERRTSSVHDELANASNNNNNNNNHIGHHNKMQTSVRTNSNEHMMPSHHSQSHLQQQQRLLQQQQQQYLQKQQLVMNQQDQFNHRGPPTDQAQHQQHASQRGVQQQQYPATNHPQQQQQMVMRQQHQQQLIMHQHRQSMDPSIPMGRQTSKQAIIQNNPPMAAHPNMPSQAQNQRPIKYIPIRDPMTGQYIPPHLVGMPQHMINQSMTQAQQQHQNNRRLVHPQQQQQQPQFVGVPQQHHNILNYGPPGPQSQVDGIVPKQAVSSMVNMPLQHHITQRPDQVQHLQMRPNSFAGQSMHQPIQNQVPRRVFRAMYDYVANDVDEVSFFENDILVDCVNVDRNWLVGKVARSGQTGMLPANYVAELPSQ